MYIDLRMLIRLVLTVFIVYNVWIGTKWAVPLAITWLFLQTETLGFIITTIADYILPEEEENTEEQ